MFMRIHAAFYMFVQYVGVGLCLFVCIYLFNDYVQTATGTETYSVIDAEIVDGVVTFGPPAYTSPNL